MDDKHIFNKEADSEMLAMEIVAFLRKWGMWRDVQIFTGGKCYTDENGELVIRDEKHPEEYLVGVTHYDCNDKAVWQDLSNPERFLDMTLEGPLWLLLRNHEYEVKIEDVSDEVRHMIVPETAEYEEVETESMEEYLEGEYSWDPMEYDSYEEWLELTQYSYMDLFADNESISDAREIEFSGREEYEDFLMRHAIERERIICEYCEDDLCDNHDMLEETFYDSGKIAGVIIDEFNDLLAKYGLWYDLCFSWSLTTYRI